MSGLSYVGKRATVPNEITNRLVTNNLLAGASPNLTSVTAELSGLTTGAGAIYAQKSYVDQQDAQFSSMAYATAQDALNVPLTAVGTPNAPLGVVTALAGGFYGAASLDGGGKIPAAQMPVLGAGYVQGPYGITNFTPGTASNTPVKVCDWNIGQISLAFQPWVFMQTFVLGSMSRPVIEVRIANSTTSVAYAASTLVAMGVGRTGYNDYASLVVVPVPAPGQTTPLTLGPVYNCWLSAWLYDANGSTVTMTAGNVAASPAFLFRGAQ